MSRTACPVSSSPPTIRRLCPQLSPSWRVTRRWPPPWALQAFAAHVRSSPPTQCRHGWRTSYGTQSTRAHMHNETISESGQAVTVAVVLFNSERTLPALIEALPAALEGTRAEVVFVDNGSADQSVDVAKRAAPWATVVETGRNGGYAAGINAALRVSVFR